MNIIRISLGVLIADQATKALGLAMLAQGQPVPVLPILSFTLGFNAGASFGMLSGTMANSPMLMALLTGTLTVTFAWMAWHARLPQERAGLALIVGGAVGNILDRLRQGAVTDFIDLHRQGWHWPAFNISDMAICFGAMLVLVSSFSFTKRQSGATHG